MEYFLQKSCCWVVFLRSEQVNQVNSIKVEEMQFSILNIVSKLFYGIRCLHAHGNTDRTTEEGVLKNKLIELYDKESTGLVCQSDQFNEGVRRHFQTLLKDA